MTNALPQILIIDDDSDCVFLTKRALRKIRPNYILESAEDGGQAMNFLSSFDSFQLILLDLKLPGIGGLEILHFIKGQERLKHIPVIVLSSSTMEKDIRESYDAGAAKFIHKSHEFCEFTKSLKDVLDTYLNGAIVGNIRRIP